MKFLLMCVWVTMAFLCSAHAKDEKKQNLLQSIVKATEIYQMTDLDEWTLIETILPKMEKEVYSAWGMIARPLPAVSLCAP